VLRQSRRAYLVADQSKFKRTAPARISSLADIDVLFTDAPPPAPIAALCQNMGTQIVVANGGQPTLPPGPAIKGLSDR
jgi:DeoR family glycerol-3-phosphate regulon repressor